MIKVENVDVYGFEHAVRAARNPMNSWDKSDSYMEPANFCDSEFVVGENDLDLMNRLYKSGVEHRTYARMIYVWMDVTAPLYWWKEMDRYTVGKSQVSCSTMHKIHAKEFTVDDFSCENLKTPSIDTLNEIIDSLNTWRSMYNVDSNRDKKDIWWQMIQLLPSSYNQKRTLCFSYEVTIKMIKERKHHKLDEWVEFVEELEKLPYMAEIMRSEQK